MSEALAGIRVVELCDEIPGAYCGRQFAAWGADVVILESESGSPLRFAPPHVRDADDNLLSFLWEWVAAGKQTVAIDRADGQAHKLVSAADVFITDWPAERLAALGPDAEAISTRFPRLVLVSLSPYGADGPYAALPGADLTVQALSGFMMMNGLPDAAPLKAPVNILAYACGVGAFVGALAALYERRTSGRGQRVELSCLELVTTLVSLLRVQYTGQSAQRQGGPGAFTALYPCRDGYVALTATAPSGWDSLVLALGATEADVPEELRSAQGRQDRQAVSQFIAQWTPHLAAESLFNEVGILGERCGLFHTAFELPSDRRLQERDFFFRIAHPVAGDLTLPGAPGRMSATPMCAPEPVSMATPDWEAARPAGNPPRPERGAEGASGPPLRGVRIVDLTQGWIGPYATQMLADLGADVIKVESHKRPDVWRGAEAYGTQLAAGAPPHAHPWNASSAFNMVNRNKRDLALDLNTADGKSLLLRLVERADVIIENYTPRVMRNFGLDYDRLRKVNPRIVMASSSGYGSTGPYADYKANGATTEVSSGWDAMLGYPGGPPLMLGGMQADAITGRQFAAMTLVALLHREQTGEGQ